MKAVTTKPEVIEQAREFLVQYAGIPVGTTVTFQMEDSHALYFETFREEFKVEKEEGNVSSRLVGRKDWQNTGLEWTGYRVCTHCKCLMISGYVIDGGLEYFCSNEHLLTTYTAEEFTEMYDDGNGETYYTNWENES
jgi:hypothetical protein